MFHLLSRLSVACYGICSVNSLLNQETLRKFYFSVHSVFILVQFSWVIHAILIVTLRYKKE